MPISYTQAFKEAAALANNTTTVIETVSMIHSLFVTPFRFAICEGDIVLGGQTYIGKQMNLGLPELSAGTNPSLSIQINNVKSSDIAVFYQTLESLEPVLLRVNSWILGSETPQGGFDNDLEVIQFSLKETVFSLSAAYPDLVNLKLPRVLYNTSNHPGLR